MKAPLDGTPEETGAMACAPAEDLPLDADVRAELDRRLDRLDREGPAGVDWEVLYAEMVPDDP